MFEPKPEMGLVTGRASGGWTVSQILFEEFDPGSERTLAAWLRHASRTGRAVGNCGSFSGGRESNAWVTYP